MAIRWQNDIEREAGSRTAWLDFLPLSTAWLLFLGPLEIRLARNLKRIRAIWWPTRHQWKRSRFLDLRICRGDQVVEVHSGTDEMRFDPCPRCG
jgi:hypothetical protein